MKISVSSSDELKRLDSFLSKRLVQFSRTNIQKMIANGLILVNEKIVKKNFRLSYSDNINIDILPLLKRMVDSLSKFISIDIPFLENERIARINELDSLIVRSDITTAEKFRKIFEAYQIEANFGKTIEVYQGFQLIDNSEKAVDFFRLGRLGLYYRTPNGKDTGYWDANAKRWMNKGSSLDAEIKAAIDIGNRQAPPNFISLPVKPISE